MRTPDYRRLVIAGVICLAMQARAQLVVLKNGQTAPAVGLRRDGATLFNTINLNGHEGVVGYAVADVDHLELPEPPQLGQAEQSLLVGKPDDAIKLLDPIIAAYFPLRDLKGAYWAQASLLKSAALQALGKRDEAAVLLTLLGEYSLDPRIALTAKARLAGLLALGGKERAPQAITLAETIIGSTDDAKVLGDAWLAKGRALYALSDWDHALDAFLHLPVFYDDDPAATAQALLACGRCYVKLQDPKRAVRSFLSVQERYSTAPEAAEAKKEIEKGGAAMSPYVQEVEAGRAESDRKLKELSEPTAPGA